MSKSRKAEGKRKQKKTKFSFRFWCEFWLNHLIKKIYTQIKIKRKEYGIGNIVKEKYK